ncbi:hypothetical protein J2X65_004600 [Ancylobacter sp. 3268]|uniref:hypothetical protein n=1 Tax=Ancylobacter sp. 3268 TaxID=2817752 RepID=UPI00285B384B|nr:hypothetical protein [Ancylobacter sp. 3268]MDR6955221.1 hypothetical protein [Ancylobacter sp. 3268]
MQPSEWIAIISAAVAGTAGFWAWRSAHHAKKQVDAAVGNLKPEFTIYVTDPDDGDPPVRVRLDVRNFNRRRLFVDDITLTPGPDHHFSNEDNLKLLIRSARQPGVSVHIEDAKGLTIPGYNLSTPSEEQFDYYVSRAGGGAVDTTVRVTVDYHLGNDGKPQTWTAELKVKIAEQAYF